MIVGEDYELKVQDIDVLGVVVRGSYGRVMRNKEGGFIDGII